MNKMRAILEGIWHGILVSVVLTAAIMIIQTNYRLF